MTRRIFIPCLNKEPKLYNFSYGTLIGGALCTIFVGISKGVLWGLGAGGIGAFIGGWISKELYKGNLQRAFYWYFPYSKELIDRNIPDSSNTHEL